MVFTLNISDLIRGCVIPMSVPTKTQQMCVCRWADKLDVLSAAATQDPEGFLGHPVNAFKLMKRLNTEWGELESLVLTDMSDGLFFLYLITFH